MDRTHRWSIGLGLAALIAATAPAAAAGAAGCKAQQRPPEALPAPAQCLRRFAVADAGDAQARLQRLFDAATAAANAGQPGRAADALDCAEALLAQNAATQDWPDRYQLVRRRGLLAYRSERIDEALTAFECALHLAEMRGDRAATAKDLKNVGSALRRLGDYRGALAALTRSLEMSRADGGATGPVLNNIADVYRELGDPTEAERRYREARQAFRDEGDAIEAAHVLESLAALALDAGQAARADGWLRTALAEYRDAGQVPYQIRIHAALTRTALARGDLDAAAQRSAAGLALAEANGQPAPVGLQLQAAKVDRLQGRVAAAQARLRAVLAAIADTDVERAAVLEELAAAQESMGEGAAALATLRDARVAERQLAQARYDRQLGWLRARFDAAERERTIAALEYENHRREADLRQRTLLLWAIAGSALAALLGLWLLLQRRQQRQRIAAAAQQALHEQALARYRQEAEALTEERKLLQRLLDSRDDAVCLLDTEGQVLAANRAARTLLDATEELTPGRNLPALLREDDAAALAAALERMDDADRQQLRLRGRDGALAAELGHWLEGDGLVLLNLRSEPAPDGSAAAARVAETSPPPTPAPMPGVRKETRADFRQALVDLMLAALDAWERGSGLNRIELAERSKLWRVHIDDGRLRTRALERYLSVARLPQNPRWRDVLRTAYFVLSECRLDAELRSDLQRQVDAVLAFTRRSAEF